MNCIACGKAFKSPSAEAQHRHNFPALCTQNKQFKVWVAKNPIFKSKQEVVDDGIDAMTDSIMKLIRVVLRKRLEQIFKVVEESVKEQQSWNACLKELESRGIISEHQRELLKK